jgi:hypothetical protein
LGGVDEGTGAPVPESVLIEIVDDLFPPLVRA